LRHELNFQDDELATAFNSMDHRPNRMPPTLPLMYDAELMVDDYIIISRFAKVVTSVLHTDHLQTQICKHENWSQAEIDKVDGKAH
jgi:hypothetical protein